MVNRYGRRLAERFPTERWPPVTVRRMMHLLNKLNTIQCFVYIFNNIEVDGIHKTYKVKFWY